MEWAIEVCLKSGLPVVASMCIGPEGDLHGVPAGECAVRMAKAGAHVGRCSRLRVHCPRFMASQFPVMVQGSICSVIQRQRLSDRLSNVLWELSV